jgi:hypothetical protein
MSSQILSTPERHRYAEREADRIRRLQMTSPSRRRNRVRRQSIVANPIPQPLFTNPTPIQPQPDLQFNPPDPQPQSHNLQNPMIHPPALNARHIAIRTRNARRNATPGPSRQMQPNAPPPHPDLGQEDIFLAQQSEQEMHTAQLQELHRQREELERQEQEHRERREQERRVQAEQRQEEARV